MPFRIIRNDITKVKADAIVNTANPDPVIGGGTDSAVYAAAGKAPLLAQRKKIGAIAPGQAVSTDAFALNAKYIIHTVGPVWVNGDSGEREVLRSCYMNSLSLASQLGCESIAFPLISTGTYGFPKDEALSIALSEIGKFLLLHEMDVILVVFDRKALELSEELAGSIDQFIDERAASALREIEYGPNNYALSRRRRLVSEAAGKNLSDVLSGAGKTFQQKLFELIDKSGMSDVEVYKKANIDRKVFSRIRSKADYTPKKKTAVALAIALELDLKQTLDLLGRAGITFSPSNTFDLIITYFLQNRNYDIFEINAALFKYGQPILGE